MQKKEFVKRLARRIGESERTCKWMTEEVIEELSLVMEDGDSVKFRGFGTFGVKRRNARRGYNMATGEELQVPAYVVPMFRAGDDLKSRVAEHNPVEVAP